MRLEKWTATEKRGVFGLSAIMALRMIGLFMVVPLFTLHANQLTGATPTLIGLAIGIYGLAQAIFQLPFGIWSDRAGRKPIILLGLLLFSAGSLLCGFAQSIQLMIAGRLLQGAGAIGSTTLATIADLTREDQRTKAMGVVGISIGFSFACAMMIGPLLARFIAFNHLFFVAFLMSFIAIILLYWIVPTPLKVNFNRNATPNFKKMIGLVTNLHLARLNSGVFFLHAIFTASFVTIPIQLTQQGFTSGSQWKLYLPTFIVAFVITLLCMVIAERNRQIKRYFLAAILALIFAEFCFAALSSSLIINLSALLAFFTGFTLLESFLPSLMSRTAPAELKGSAMGLFSCAQFLGIFVGGLIGGWLYGQFGFAGVYLVNIILALIWLNIAFYIQPPNYLITELIQLNPHQQATWQAIANQLHKIPGMADVIFVAEENVIHLKMGRETIKHPDFIRLKEQLQSR